MGHAVITCLAKHPIGSYTLDQIPCHNLEGVRIGLSLMFGQGKTDPHLWALIPEASKIDIMLL